MEICSKMHIIAVQSYSCLQLALGYMTETNNAHVGICHVMQAPTSEPTCRGTAATQQNFNKLGSKRY
jgi:hypothetical protein